VPADTGHLNKDKPLILKHQTAQKNIKLLSSLYQKCFVTVFFSRFGAFLESSSAFVSAFLKTIRQNSETPAKASQSLAQNPQFYPSLKVKCIRMTSPCVVTDKKTVTLLSH